MPSKSFTLPSKSSVEDKRQGITLGELQSDMQSRKRYCLDRELCCKYAGTILHAADVLINILTKLTQK